jgi:hypothetical protein
MRDNAFDGYGAHVLYVLELLCLAPFVQVPRPLYRRRARAEAGAVVHGWGERPPEERLAAWSEHAVACLRHLSQLDLPADERARVVTAQLARTLRGYRRSTRIKEPAEASERTDLVLLAALIERALGGEPIGPDEIGSLREDEALWEALGGLPTR